MSASHSSEPEFHFVCACKDWMRTACIGLPFFRTYQSHPYCVLHYPCSDKSKEFDEVFNRKLANHDFDFQGVQFPNPVSLSKTFSKETKFRSAIFHADVEFDSSIFKCDADFASAIFLASASFRFTQFEGRLFFDSGRFHVSADFTKARFHENAYFTSVTFRNAGFGSSTFAKVAHFASSQFMKAARFNGAAFGAEAYFGGVIFHDDAQFETATFEAFANFSSATFKGLTKFKVSAFAVRVDYSHANFLDHVRFAEKEKRPASSAMELDLQFVRASNPKNISFHTVTLRPHWFVNVDPSGFDFVDVEWSNLMPQRPDQSKRIVSRSRWHDRLMEEELNCLIEKGISRPRQLLSSACRRLAVNAEENYRYAEASEFRYWSMEIRRRHEGDSGLSPGKLHSLYYVVSLYGEGIGRALSVLVGIWVAFAIAYLITGHIKIVESNLYRPVHQVLSALNYSFQVITLQKPDKPTGYVTPLLVSLETILGPLQAALLALAVRRKFMR